MARNSNKNQEEPLEAQLWKAADKLRKNIDAAEYKHIVLGLIFLKYISDAFEELYKKLDKGEGSTPAPSTKTGTSTRRRTSSSSHRWPLLVIHPVQAKLPEIGKDIDMAMDAIEKENPSLKASSRRSSRGATSTRRTSAALSTWSAT